MALGSTVVDNSVALENIDPLRKRVLLERVGVPARYVGKEDENVLTLSRQAVRELVRKDTIPCDFIVAVTQTSPNKFPHIASILQNEFFPASKCPSFDLNLGCSGFVYAYIVLNALHRSGHTKNPILICADTYNKYINAQTNSAALLFSDAAICMNFRDEACTEILAADLGGDGAGANSLCLVDSDGHSPMNIYMNGAAVMQFTMSVVPDSITKVLERAKLRNEDVDLYCFHQASAVVLSEIARKLKIPAERMPTNLSRYGNTVSCSVPLLLKELSESGQLRKGMKILLAGFGVGLSWATCIIKI